MNKSFVTNLIALSFIIYGFNSPIYSNEIIMSGFFALSGALTNWIAIHMLFEKVPFFYGSGVILERFEDFKKGIKKLVMEELFTDSSVADFVKKKDYKKKLSLEKINHEQIFDKLSDAIEESSLGSMLQMFGGRKALNPLKEPVQKKINEVFEELSANISDSASKLSSDISESIESIVDSRLNELTPEHVQTIIKDMIHKHLGWLVVWGGVFGFIIGLTLSIVGR